MLNQSSGTNEEPFLELQKPSRLHQGCPEHPLNFSDSKAPKNPRSGTPGVNFRPGSWIILDAPRASPVALEAQLGGNLRGPCQLSTSAPETPINHLHFPTPLARAG